MTDERSNRPRQDHDLERPEVLDIDVTRRSIVSLLLAAVGWSAGIGRALAASSHTLAIPSLNEEFRTPGVLPRPHLRVIRPDDFIYLDVEYENIATAGDPAKALVRVDPAKPALLIVNHQPQAVADQAYEQVTKSEADTMGGTSAQPLGVELAPTPPQVAGARMARPSRVAFVMPHGISSIPFTLAQLLKAFRTWEMNLDYQAAPDTRRFARVAVPLIADGLKKHFDLAAAQLKSGAGAASQSALEKALQRAYAVAIAQAATNGGTPPASGAVDAIIRQEIGRNLPGSASQITQRLGTPGSITINRKAVVNFHLLPSKPHPPADTVTAIELPYRLIQSPLATAGWYHSDGLETHANRTELWHTRLGARRTSRIDDTAPEPLRAIWSPDYVNPEPHGTPFTMSLDGLDRQMLVKLTAGYNEVVPSIAGRHQYAPTPAMARRVMLTALGGWLLEDGNWPGGRPAGVDLTEWNHYAAMARDYYVRVVYAGYLFPLGHAASLVKVTERKFEDQPGGGRVALLRQRYFIIVRQKTRFYPGANQPYEGRGFPFSRVDILTATTPDLAEPGSDPNDRIPDSMNFYNVTKPRRMAFWPVTKGAFPGALGDFMFQAVGYDQAGSAIPFTTPLFFVSANVNNPADLATIITAYKTVKDQARRKRPFNGAVIQFAPNVNSDHGDTNTPTVSITFAGTLPTAPVPPNPSEGDPAQFYPGAESAELKLPAVQRLLGNDQPVIAQVASAYLQNGLDETANKGQVFLSLIGASGTLPPGVPSDKGGGLVAPNIYPTAFSRTFGTVAGANNAQKFISGTFDPKDFLADSLMLFGVVPLGEIIAAVGDFKKAPQLVNQELPERVTSTFDLHQQNLQSYTLPGTSNPIFVPDADGVASALDINAVTTVERTKDKPAGSPTSTVTGKINNFKINLFGCFILTFDSLTFDSKPGQKPDVGVNLNADHGVLFGGPLEFVNKLKDFIPCNGFSDPPSLAVTAAGVTASYSLSLPAVTMGVLTLQNINLGAGFNLPFDGNSPGARFNFAERHNPFNLTVSLFGGGGFLAIAVSAANVDEVEAQLEFGAYAALNIGVASGSVYLKGGFYFHWQDADNSIDLEAFVELGGHLTVIGLISVSLTFHVDLAYKSENKHSLLIGQATLTVDVDVLFFSKSVSLTVQKQFAGSAADPKFVDFIPDASTWQTYCAAFG